MNSPRRRQAHVLEVRAVRRRASPQRCQPYPLVSSRNLEPPGRRVPLLDLQPGDRVHLPLVTGERELICWSEPVVITSVLMIDTGLVQVRWIPTTGEDPWSAHLLLMGRAFAAGAIVALPSRGGDRGTPT